MLHSSHIDIALVLPHDWHAHLYCYLNEFHKGPQAEHVSVFGIKLYPRASQPFAHLSLKVFTGAVCPDITVMVDWE